MPSTTCSNCRRRKTKCDREEPCGACVKSHLDLSCSYRDEPLKSSKGSDFIRVVTSTDYNAKRIRKDKQKFHGAASAIQVSPPSHTFVSSVVDDIGKPVVKKEVRESPSSNPGSDNNHSSSVTSGDTYVSTNSASLGNETGLKNLPIQDLAITAEKRQGIFKLNTMLGVNPINKMDDMINLHDTYTLVNNTDRKRKTNQGPFAWSSLMKKDPGLRILMTYLKNPAIKTYGMLDSDVKLKTAKSSEEARDIQDPHLRRVLYQAKEPNLIDMILQSLPPRKAIWIWIDNFFDMVFPSIPCIDEFEFRKDIAFLLYTDIRTQDRVQRLSVTSSPDLSLLGLLLVVLKYSELCLHMNLINDGSVPPANVSNLSDDDFYYILEYPISEAFISYADSCVNHFAIYKTPDLLSLQLMIYLSSIQYHLPGETDVSESGILYSSNGLLVQMGYKLGLHLNPEKYQDSSSDISQDNLTRKIWSYILIIDIIAACSTGDPKMVMHSNYDNRLSDSKLNVSNVMRSAVDQLIIVSLNYMAATITPICGLAEIVADINRQHLVSTVSNYLSTFEKGIPILDQTLKSLCVNYPERSVEVKYLNTLHIKFTYLFSGFVISMNHQLFLYYENINPDLSFFYAKKLTHLITIDMMPHYAQFLNNKNSIKLFIHPVAIRHMHKSNQTILALLMRVNCQIYKCKNLPDHAVKQMSDKSYSERFSNYLRLSNLLLNCGYYSIKTLEALSTKYWYAWALTKGFSLFIEIVSQDKFYEESRLADAFQFSFNNDQIKQLISICDFTSSFFTEDDYNFFNSRRNDFSIYQDIIDPKVSYQFSNYDLSDIDKAWLEMISKGRRDSNASVDSIFGFFDPILDASFEQFDFFGNIPDL